MDINKPVALPERKLIAGHLTVEECYRSSGCNAYHDETAKLGPLFTHPAPAVQQEPVAWLDPSCGLTWLANRMGFAPGTKFYTHADPGEVKERIRKETESYSAEVERLRADRDDLQRYADELNAERCEWERKVDSLRAQLTELTQEDEKRDALQQLLNARDEEVDKLRTALKFYADKDHFYHGDDNWDTVSGEPANILWHAEEPYSVEDGWFARKALENQA